MDTLEKYISTDASVSFAFLDATQTVRESIKRVGCLPPAGIHLGQALMACSLIHSLYGEKHKHKLRMQWSVDGQFGNVFVDASFSGGLRGTISNPQHFSGNLTESLGQGLLQVIREDKKSHTGMVTSAGDVCTDALEYLHQSEQRQCAMNLFVEYDTQSSDLQIKKALGYLFEILPSDNPIRKDIIATFWEEKFKELGSLSEWPITSTHPIQSMVDHTLGGLSQKSSEKKVFFECTCSKERAERALAFANKKDKEHYQVQAEIVCEYCGQKYDINLKDKA